MIRGARGFTLAEVLVATAILTIGLVAIATGFQYATSGVATGRGETTAVFLAEQRIEQLKALALTNFTAAGLAAGGPVVEYCQPTGATNCTGTATTGSYTRQTWITDVVVGTGCPGAPAAVACKQVRVQVSYRPVTSQGDLSQQRTVEVYTVLAPRT